MAELVIITEEEKIRHRLQLTPTQSYYLFIRMFKLGQAMKNAKTVFKK